jgi:CRISPR system Cascade subunit CasE
MFLSRIGLDTSNRETLRILSSPQLTHGAVEQSFHGDRQRRLWRIDLLERKYFLLVLSESQPDFSGIVKQYGIPGAEPSWETKDYDRLLERIRPDHSWRFRLKANPVHSVKDRDTMSRGKVMAHVTSQQQKQWLVKRAQHCGFSLNPDAFDVIHTQWQKFNKEDGHEVTFRTATYEGILTVTNPDCFRESLITGIGRAKAYGCGLMTVISVGGGGDA